MDTFPNEMAEPVPEEHLRKNMRHWELRLDQILFAEYRKGAQWNCNHRQAVILTSQFLWQIVIFSYIFFCNRESSKHRDRYIIW